MEPVPTFSHSNTFKLYKVLGFDWNQLPLATRETMHRYLTDKERPWSGKEPHTYRITKVQFEKVGVYSGTFAQQFVEPLRKYTSTVTDKIEIHYPYEDRQFIYVTARNLIVIEQRRFVQSDLSHGLMMERLQGILQSLVGEYTVSLKPYRESVPREQIIQEFFGNPSLRVRAEGVKNGTVGDDVVFFNPLVDYNKVSRILFNEKILPYTYAMEVTSTKLSELGAKAPSDKDDLRKNPLVRALLSLAEQIREIEIYDPKLGRRRIVRSQYDDKIELEKVYSTQEDLALAILRQLADLPGFDMEVRPEPQLKFSLDPGDEGGTTVGSGDN